MTDDGEDLLGDIEHCPIHDQTMDDGCEFCLHEYMMKTEVLAKLRDQVKDRVQALARDGAKPHPSLTSDTRLELLIEAVLQDRNRLHFEVEVGRRILHTLNELTVAAAQQKLQGGVKPGGLIVPGPRPR